MSPRAPKPRPPAAAGRTAPAGPAPAAAAAPPPSPEAVARWVTSQRWYASTDLAAATGPTAGATPGPVVTAVPLPTDPPVSITLVDLPSGHRYQLLTISRPADVGTGPRSAPPARRPAPRPEPAPIDSAGDPDAARALGRFVAGGGRSAPGAPGTVVAHWLAGAPPPGDGPARPLGAEQTNTSLVIGGSHVLKVIRRLQAGPHPEIEIGRHLAAVAAGDDGPVAPVAPLTGWYELNQTDGSDPDQGSTALGMVHQLVPGALDGWALALSGLAGDPGGLLARLHALGDAVARLHRALAHPALPSPGEPATVTGHDAGRDAGDPARFGRVPLAPDRLDAVVDGIVQDARRLLGPDGPVAGATGVGPAGTDPAATTGGVARSLRERVGSDAGASIRHHGDLHLGQTVVGPHGWVILDFEGEPSRPLEQRRQRHSALRDVAGMLRSLAYAAATHRRSGGHGLAAGWEPAARAAFLDGYLAVVDPTLLPASAATTHALLALFELEKVVYEIGYEAAHRPDWLPIPVDGLHRILGSPHR